MAVIVLIDSWIVDRVFDDGQINEAAAYASRYKRRYQCGTANYHIVPDAVIAEGMHTYLGALGIVPGEVSDGATTTD